MTEEKSTVPAALPANIKQYVKLYSIIDENREGENPLVKEAAEVIEALDSRIKSFDEKTPDRLFLDDYKATAVEGALRVRERKKKYEAEKQNADEEKKRAIDDLGSDKDYTGKTIGYLVSRAIPVVAAYKGLSTILASADAVIAATLIIGGATELIIRRVSKTEAEKIGQKYSSRMLEIETWFSHDKGLIYRDAEEKAENSYKAYYGRPSPFPEPRPKATDEPPPKLYGKEKNIFQRLGLSS